MHSGIHYLVLFAEVSNSVLHRAGVVIYNQAGVVLLKRAEITRVFDLWRLEELLEEGLVVTLWHDAHVIQACLFANTCFWDG